MTKEEVIIVHSLALTVYMQNGPNPKEATRLLHSMPQEHLMEAIMHTENMLIVKNNPTVKAVYETLVSALGE